MKFFIALALLVVAAAAAPPPTNAKDAQVVHSEFDNIGVDKYSYGFETSDGIVKQESGQLKNVGTENEAIEARGSFSYVGPDGVTYSIAYIANELGFQAQGAHIPVAPQ